MKEVTIEDAGLVRAAQSGDKAAFERLVERHFGLIYSIGYAHLGQVGAAEDLSQEVFLRGYLYLGSLKEPGCFAAWLSRIARNLAITWRKRGQRLSKLVSQVPLEELPEQKMMRSSEPIEKQEDAQSLRKAIFALPVEQREIVMLHYFENFGKKEIAERLGVHPATVGRHLKKALAKMKRSLEPVLRSAAPAFRAKPATIARTVALIGAASAMSTTAKAALVAGAGGKAWAAGVSAGAGKVGASGGGLGLLKTTATTVITGAKIMTIGKATTIAVAAVIMTVAGLNIYRQVPKNHRSKLPRTQKDTLRAKKECFPDEIYDYIVQTSLNGKALLDQSVQPNIVGTVAKTIDKNRNLWEGFLVRFSTNVARPAVIEEILLSSGRRESNLLCVFDEQGELMKHRFADMANPGQDSNIPRNIKDLYVTINMPLEVNQDGVLFMMDREGWLKTNYEGGYLVEMYGHPMFAGVFQQILIVPKGYEVVESTEEPFSVEQVGDFEMYLWQKTVKFGEEYDIDVTLERTED